MAVGSSPLTRGARDFDADGGGGAGLIPAHAGSTTGCSGLVLARSAHPRSRGEHLIEEADDVMQAGSSPLTRGARIFAVEEVAESGLIPAHAGST